MSANVISVTMGSNRFMEVLKDTALAMSNTVLRTQMQFGNELASDIYFNRTNYNGIVTFEDLVQEAYNVIWEVISESNKKRIKCVTTDYGKTYFEFTDEQKKRVWSEIEKPLRHQNKITNKTVYIVEYDNNEEEIAQSIGKVGSTEFIKYVVDTIGNYECELSLCEDIKALHLTQNQLEILTLRAKGYSVQEIAEHKGVKAVTIYSTLQKIGNKLNDYRLKQERENNNKVIEESKVEYPTLREVKCYAI